MNNPLRVLLVEDSQSDAKLVALALRSGLTRPVELETVATADSMREALTRSTWDAVVSDWSLPGFSALGALEVVKKSGLDVAFIIVSGTIGEDQAADGMRAGAHDFVLKEKLTRLGPALERELQQKRTREARRFADAALAAVTECAPAFILAVGPTGKILFINKVLPQFKKEDVIGSDWLMFLAPAEHEQQSQRLKRIIATGVHEIYESAVVLPDGSSLCFSAHMGPMRLKDQVIGAVLVSTDISELKRTQAEFAAAQRLAAVGTLAAGIAHEINTPIQFVNDSVHFLSGASADTFTLLQRLAEVKQLALAGAPRAELERACALANAAEEEADLPYLVDGVPKAFQRCVEGLGRVATIVRSMKEFAHPAQVEMGPVDLNRAIQSTLTIARGEYKYVAELETDFGDLPPVTCHINEINQVVLNLIVNAAHAIGDVVKETNCMGTIRVGTRQDGDNVLISIGDTGTGIPEAIAHRIFDPFFTTKDVGKGTGQGLALAWAVVTDKHAGQLTFSSKPAAGTTFLIRLPIAGKHQADAAAQS